MFEAIVTQDADSTPPFEKVGHVWKRTLLGDLTNIVSPEISENLFLEDCLAKERPDANSIPEPQDELIIIQSELKCQPSSSAKVGDCITAPGYIECEPSTSGQVAHSVTPSGYNQNESSSVVEGSTDGESDKNYNPIDDFDSSDESDQNPGNSLD